MAPRLHKQFATQGLDREAEAEKHGAEGKAEGEGEGVLLDEGEGEGEGEGCVLFLLGTVRWFGQRINVRSEVLVLVPVLRISGQQCHHSSGAHFCFANERSWGRAAPRPMMIIEHCRCLLDAAMVW